MELGCRQMDGTEEAELKFVFNLEQWKEKIFFFLSASVTSRVCWKEKGMNKMQ